ncbi:MAG: 7TM domain-containing protein [Patescibacteria group bacterium]
MKEGIVLLALAAKLISPSPIPAESMVPEIATPTAKIDIQEAARQDITERTSPIKDRLGAYLAEKPREKLNWHNFLQQAIRQAVEKGVSANTIVLVLLFPLVAGLIAAARHLLGLTGFGIFVPAMLSVAFLATGIRVGMLMFLVIWALAAVSRKLTNWLKLQYLPRMALLMWFVSLGVLGVLLGAVNVGLGEVSAVSIFPIMILMLLTENFIEVQTGKSQREAFQVMLQTIGMALAGAILMRLDGVQKFVLLNPEISLLMIGLFDVYVGRYVGLRALEYVKFKKLLK